MQTGALALEVLEPCDRVVRWCQEARSRMDGEGASSEVGTDAVTNIRTATAALQDYYYYSYDVKSKILNIVTTDITDGWKG